MCSDAFFVCAFCSGSTGLCWFLPVSESDIYSSVSSSFLSTFHCFVGDISLLDSCALHMTRVIFYFYTGGCAAAACRPKIKAHLNYQSSKQKTKKCLLKGKSITSRMVRWAKTAGPCRSCPLKTFPTRCPLWWIPVLRRRQPWTRPQRLVLCAHRRTRQPSEHTAHRLAGAGEQPGQSSGWQECPDAKWMDSADKHSPLVLWGRCENSASPPVTEWVRENSIVKLRCLSAGIHCRTPRSETQTKAGFNVKQMRAIHRWSLMLVGWVLLYVHKDHRFIRVRSPGRPPRLSHSSWALSSMMANGVH